jgi:hypothetical protein
MYRMQDIYINNDVMQKILQNLENIDRANVLYMRMVCKYFRDNVDVFIQKASTEFTSYRKNLLIQRKQCKKSLMLYYFGQNHCVSKNDIHTKLRYRCSRCMSSCHNICESHTCIRQRGLKEMLLGPFICTILCIVIVSRK